MEYQPGLGLHMPLPHPGQDVEEGLVVIVEDVDVDPHTGQQVESLQQSSHLTGLSILLLPLENIYLETFDEWPSFQTFNIAGTSYIIIKKLIERYKYR